MKEKHTLSPNKQQQQQQQQRKQTTKRWEMKRINFIVKRVRAL